MLLRADGVFIGFTGEFDYNGKYRRDGDNDGEDSCRNDDRYNDDSTAYITTKKDADNNKNHRVGGNDTLAYCGDSSEPMGFGIGVGFSV